MRTKSLGAVAGHFRRPNALGFLPLLEFHDSQDVLRRSPPTSPWHYRNRLRFCPKVAGQNINMVSGTQYPGGNPYPQRQNDPSMAVSTRNPLHLLAGCDRGRIPHEFAR